MPEIEGGHSTFWLTTLTIDPAVARTDRTRLMAAFEAENIEARPVWKPMHLQPLYRENRVVGGKVAERLFENGLCLPSGSSLQPKDRDRVIEIARSQLA
jgi:pyridoxal phosphate-dependent aminotransferase EpsN